MKKYLWLVIFLAIATSLVYPAPGNFFKPYVSPLLMLLMFFSFLDLKIRLVFRYLHMYQKIAASLVIIHFVSPILLLPYKNMLPPEIFLGLVLAATITSGISVVFLSKIYGGIEEEAIVTTAASHLLSPVLVPFSVFVFAHEVAPISVPFMAWTLFKLLIFPLVAAEFVQRLPVSKLFKKIETNVTVFLLFAIIIAVISPVRDSLIGNLNLALFLLILVFVLLSINFLLGLMLATSRKEQITFAISVSYKNFALSTVLAASLFGPQVALPSIIYAVASNLFLIPASLFIKLKN